MKKEKGKRNEVRLFEWRGIHLFILFAVPFLLYVQTFHFDYSYHDDDSIVLYNTKSLHEFDLHKIFFSDAWLLDKKIELYRPFQTLTYAVDYLFTGTTASGYHIHNVLIFLLGIQLLYFLLLSFKLTEQTSFFLSLIYSVHFLLAHTVSWIPARGDLYLFAFSMGSFLTFYLFTKTQKGIYIAFTSLFYFGALLSKESGIVLLPLIYLVALLVWKIDFRKLKNYFLLIPGIILTIIYLWMRSKSIAPNQNIYSISGFIYNLPVIPEEVCKFFVPLFFSVMPSFSVSVTVTGSVLMAAILVLIFMKRKKINTGILLSGTGFFFIPLFPTLLYKPAFTGFAYDYLDHRMFFPGVGLLLIAYALFETVVEKKYSPNYLYALVGVMATVTFSNTTTYENYTSYYENAIATNPKSGLAWENYASSLARENKYDEAMKKFNQALVLNPENTELLGKLADSYYTLKDYKKMMVHCRSLIKVDPKDPKGYFDMAMYFSDVKMNDSALKYVNESVKKSPDNSDAFMYKGVIESKTGNNDSAIVSLGKSISLNTGNSTPYFQRGNIYANTGRYKEALDDFVQYVKLNPNDRNGYYYLGQVYCILGNVGEGCTYLHTAEDMGVSEARAKITYYCK
ncbi:MAG: tetratricopeptide repeat protein [Bacteroidota bacterium]